MVSKTESPECQEKIGGIQPGTRYEVCLNVVHVNVIPLMCKVSDRQKSTGTCRYSSKHDETRCKLEILFIMHTETFIMLAAFLFQIFL